VPNSSQTVGSFKRPNEFGRAFYYVLGELHSPKTGQKGAAKFIWSYDGSPNRPKNLHVEKVLACIYGFI
jgi:hypothetical protein